MKNRYKHFIKDLVPPFILRYYKSITKSGITFKGKYTSWHEALKSSTGYDNKLILEKVKNESLKVKSGEAIYERDSVLFDKIEYSFPVLAALLRVANANEGKLSVLDFGGSLGTSYFQCRNILSDLKSLQWYIVEQPHFVACGKEFFEDETLKFYESIDECLKVHQPNAVLLSSVLQYLEKPYELLDRITEFEFPYLIFDITPFYAGNDDIITIQRVPKTIYSADYPCWIFSLDKFNHFLSDKYKQLVYFDSLDFSALDKFSAKYLGFFFKLRK